MEISISWQQVEKAYELMIKKAKREEFDLILTCIKTLPGNKRFFNPETKLWYIDKAIIDALFITLDSCKILYTVHSKHPQGQDTKDIQAMYTKLEQSILAFVKLCPKNAMEKAFKLGMAELHPDRLENQKDQKASTANSAKLSEAWQVIKKELYND